MEVGTVRRPDHRPFVLHSLSDLPCCIVAPLLGGFCAVAIYRTTNPPSLTSNDGASLGAQSGLLGTAIYAVLMVPLAIFLGGLVGGVVGQIAPDLKDVPPEVQRLLDFLFSNIGTVVGLVVFVKILGHLAMSVLFGILGGILGVAILVRGPKSDVRDQN